MSETRVVPLLPQGYAGDGTFRSPHKGKDGRRYERIRLPDGRWITKKITSYSK